MARDGSVGQQTYDAVNALVASGKTRQEAFDQIALEKNAKAGTVAANFYRVARKQATPNKPTPARRSPSPRTPSLAASTNSSGMAAQLEACIRQMVDDAVDQRMQRLVRH